MSRFFSRTGLSLIGALALVFPAHALHAQESPAATAAKLGQAGLGDNWGYEFLKSMTTEIGQRLAGTEPEARAAAWAVTQLKKAGYYDVRTETFPMKVWERGVETADVVKPHLQHLVITALGGSVATPPKGIEAEAVIFPTYAALLAAAPGSLTGKIAVVTQPMVRGGDGGSGYGANNPIRRQGPSEAARRGAIAYLHHSLGTDSHRLAHTGALNYIEGLPRIPAAALSGPDADQLARLGALGPVTIHLTLTPTEHDGESVTVIGDIKGREKPDEMILIGGHLDSWDLATGATDDGAGVAIMAGAGRLIANLPQHPKRTVRVVLWGAEEMDYSGPAYARMHEAEDAKTVLAGESDSGARKIYAVELPPGAAKSPFGKTLADLLPPLDAFLRPAPALGGGSDVEGIHAAGVPVMSARQNTVDYFDTHHTSDDTFDKIDAKELAQNVAVWATTIYLAAETDVDFRELSKAAH